MTRLALLMGDTGSPSGINRLIGTCWYLAAVLDRISSLVVFSDAHRPPGVDAGPNMEFGHEAGLNIEFGHEALEAFQQVVSVAEWRCAPLPRAGADLRRLEIDHLVVGVSRPDASAARILPVGDRNDVYSDFLTERGAASKLAYLVNDIRHRDEPIDLTATARVLSRIRREVAGRPAAVFGTGPSLDLVDWADFTDHVNILCNSTVGNPSVLAAADPSLIAAADPVFHSSYGTHAVRFRHELATALAATDAWFICPTRDAPLYRHYLPKEAADRVLPVPLSQRVDFNLDLCSVLEVKSTANILTLLLLPLACTFSRSVTIAGCDGKPSSSDYFWTHSRQVQFDAELQETKQPFAGFFDIDNDTYYEEHLAMLTALVEQADAQLVSLVNATPSHIPVLQRITTPDALHAGLVRTAPSRSTLGPFGRSQRVSVDAMRAAYDMAALTWPTGISVDASCGELTRRTELELGIVEGADSTMRISRSIGRDGGETITIGPQPTPVTTTSVILTWYPAGAPGETRYLHSAGSDDPTLLRSDGPTTSTTFVLPSEQAAERFLQALAEQAARTVRPASW